MGSGGFLDYAVPERGDDLFRTMMQYIWQFKLNDRVVSHDTACKLQDWITGGDVRKMSERSMINAVLWFRKLYGELDG